MADAALTDRQTRFVEEYLVDLNATAAAKRAGYSEKSARQQATENLAKPAVQAAIKAAIDARQERTEISQDFVLRGFKKVADTCLEEIHDEDGNRELVDATQANRALEMIGKHLGMFVNKVEVSTTRYVARIPEPAATVDEWLKQSK